LIQAVFLLTKIDKKKKRCHNILLSYLLQFFPEEENMKKSKDEELNALKTAKEVAKFLSRKGLFVCKKDKDEKFDGEETEMGIVMNDPDLSKMSFKKDGKPFIIWPIIGGLLFVFSFSCLIGIKNGAIIGLAFFIAICLVFYWIIKSGKAVEVRIANLYLCKKIPCTEIDCSWKMEVFGEKFLPKAKEIGKELEEKFQSKVEIRIGSKEILLYEEEAFIPHI